MGLLTAFSLVSGDMVGFRVFFSSKGCKLWIVQERDCCSARYRWKVSGLISGRILSKSFWGWEVEADSVIFISIYIMIFF